MDASTSTALDLDSLLYRLRQNPSVTTTNLRLIGIDNTTIGILLDHAQAPRLLRHEEIQRRWPRDRLLHIARESDAEVVAPLDLGEYVEWSASIREAAKLWDEMTRRLRDWWNGIELRSEGAPRRVEICCPLYVVAVARNLPSGTRDVCSWSTTRSASSGVKVSLAIAEFGIHRTVPFRDSRTVEAVPGQAEEVYVAAVVTMQPVHLYLYGEPKEAFGEKPVDLAIKRPVAISTRTFAGAVEPKTSEPLREYPAQDTPDPEPPGFEQSLESEVEFGIKVPLPGDSGNCIGISLKFNRTWAAAHKFDLPAKQVCYLCELDGEPGTVLAAANPNVARQPGEI